MRESRVGGGGAGGPLDNHENIGCLSNGPGTLENHKTTKSAFNAGPVMARL